MKRIGIIAAGVAAGLGIVVGLVFLFAPLATGCSVNATSSVPGVTATHGPELCQSYSLVQVQPVWPMPLLAIVVWSVAPSVTAIGLIQRLRGPATGNPWIAVGVIAEATVLISFGAAPIFVRLVLLPLVIVTVFGLTASHGTSSRVRPMRERDQRIQRRGRELMKLVTERLPQDFDVANDGPWPGIGVGLLSRMVTTLGSMLDIQPGRRELDAATLGRSLYEHAVHFAWLAADPSAQRLEEWRKDDLVARLNADADMRRHSVKIFTDERRAELESEVQTLVGNPLKLEQLAIAADKHWTSRIPGLVGASLLTSFSGLYASLYRYYSGTAHPSMIGLNRVTEDLPNGGRRVERHVIDPASRQGIDPPRRSSARDGCFQFFFGDSTSAARSGRRCGR